MSPCLPLVGWLLALSVGLASAQPVIVQHSQCRAEIVIADKPPCTTKLEAMRLQAYVAKITGDKYVG